jgi:DNA-binding MarR family transcriptional regulator
MTNDPLFVALAAFSERYDFFMSAVAREAAHYGFPPAEARIIDSLRDRRLSQSQIRADTQIERGQLSRAIKTLIAKGLVEEADHLSRGWSTYRLTTKGIGRYRASFHARINAIQRTLRSMLRPERKALMDALTALGSHQFVDVEADETVRYRTAYPGEVGQVIKNALAFYSHKGLKFNSQIEGYVLGQFAEACSRTHHHIIVYEYYGEIAGSVLLVIDLKRRTARFEGLWFTAGWCQDEDIIGVLKLAEKRAVSAGCTRFIAQIPRHDAWPNLYKELGWKLCSVKSEKIAGVVLEIETWSRSQ